MRLFHHLSSLGAALVVLLDPVQADLDNTTSPTSIFRSVSSHEYEALECPPDDVVASDRIFTLLLSTLISSDQSTWPQATFSLHRTGIQILDLIFTTMMGSLSGLVQAHLVAPRLIIHMSAITKARTTSASSKGTSTTDGRADMALS